MNKKSNLLLSLVAVVLIIIFTPIFGKLYEIIIGRQLSGGFWGPSNPEYIPGFFMSYSFFISFLTTVFGDKNKYKIGGILLVIILLIIAILNLGEDLIINIGIVIIGWLLAQGILLIRKKMEK